MPFAPKPLTTMPLSTDGLLAKAWASCCCCFSITSGEEPERELGKVQRLLGLETPIPADSIASRSGGYEAEWERMARGNPIERRTVRRIQERFGAEIESFGYRCDDLRHRSEDWQRSLS